MNNEDFCSYEIAQALKKAGFHWECNYYYHGCEICEGCGRNDYNDSRSYPNWISAPTMAQAQKWFREEKGIYVEPRFEFDYFGVVIVDDDGGYKTEMDEEFESYESALSAGIEAALKLIEEENI